MTIFPPQDEAREAARRIVETRSKVPSWHLDIINRDALLIARALLDSGWRDMDSAPKDGTVFLACDPRFGVVKPAMRRLQYIVGSGAVRSVDMGAWLYVNGLDQDITTDDTNGEVEWSIAPDKHNKGVPMMWRPLPLPPVGTEEE